MPTVPNCRERRMAMLLTQSQLAEMAGLSNKTVENAEAGKSVLVTSASRISRILATDRKPAPAEIHGPAALKLSLEFPREEDLGVFVEWWRAEGGELFRAYLKT